jgi:hypothetical protein
MCYPNFLLPFLLLIFCLGRQQLPVLPLSLALPPLSMIAAPTLVAATLGYMQNWMSAHTANLHATMLMDVPERSLPMFC